eukprot:gene16895-biopygen21840
MYLQADNDQVPNSPAPAARLLLGLRTCVGCGRHGALWAPQAPGGPGYPLATSRAASAPRLSEVHRVVRATVAPPPLLSPAGRDPRRGDDEGGGTRPQRAPHPASGAAPVPWEKLRPFLCPVRVRFFEFYRTARGGREGGHPPPPMGDGEPGTSPPGGAVKNVEMPEKRRYRCAPLSVFRHNYRRSDSRSLPSLLSSPTVTLAIVAYRHNYRRHRTPLKVPALSPHLPGRYS